MEEERSAALRVAFVTLEKRRILRVHPGRRHAPACSGSYAHVTVGDRRTAAISIGV